MIDTKARQAFWEVVEDCLVTFHQENQFSAHLKSQDFRKEVETGAYPTDDLIYHEEPFDIACAIAQTPEADVDQLFDQSFSAYETILKTRGW
jgi:hypothetical protein